MEQDIGIRRFAALVFMMGLASSVPAQAETLYAPHGARGDFGGELRCPPGKYVTRFSGGTGQIIDRIAIVCAPSVRSGYASQRGPDINALVNSFTSDSLGGGGGGPSGAGCPVGQLVFAGYVNLNIARRQVEYLGFECITPGQSQTSGAGGRYGGTGDTPNWHGLDSDDGRMRAFRCKPGEAMTGLTVRYGEHVNALGLICNVVVLAMPRANPAPAPTRVITRTGRAPSSGTQLALASAFQGGWNTVTNADGRFAMDIRQHGTFSGRANEELPFSGKFTNSQGASQYNGTLFGTVNSSTRVFTFEYEQPGISGKGRGTFTLSADGNSFTGGGTYNETTPFTWNGTRAPSGD